MARIKCMVVTAVFMGAFAVVEANQCSSGGECPVGNKPSHVVSMLQTKLQMNALKDAFLGEYSNKMLTETITITQALTICNAMVLLAILAFVVKVKMTHADSASALDASEDMSISNSLPPVLLWASLGILLICFNKFMYLAPEEGGFGFPCPVALTWWHMFTGMICTSIVRVVRPQLMPAVQEDTLDRCRFITDVVPIGMVLAFYLALGNSAYIYLSVSFVQMLKSAGPMAVYAISIAFGMEKITTAAIVSLSVVVVGVCSASFGEIGFSWFGFGLQFLAFIFDGVRLVLLKKLTSCRGTKLDPLSGLYYYSPVCVVCLVLPVYFFEGHLLATTLGKASPSLYGMIVVSGLLAFSLNVSMLALFKQASATTVSMASVCRDIFLTFGSSVIFHTPISRVQLFGYLSACLGVVLWDEIKRRPQAFQKAFGVDQSEQITIAASPKLPVGATPGDSNSSRA